MSELTKCPTCGEEIHIGDYPFCPHDSIYHTSAQRFDPIVVHQNPDGSYYWPGATDEVVKEGRREVVLRTIQEADRVCREENARQDAILREFQRHTESNRLAVRKQNREYMDSIRHKLSPAVRQYLDRARAHIAEKDQRRENSRPKATNFHFDVFAHDASNREQHADERTGWKRRKG